MKINKKDLKLDNLKDFNITEFVNAFSEIKNYLSNRSERNIFFNISKLSYFIKTVLPYIGNVQNKYKILPVNEYKKFLCIVKEKHPKLYEKEYLVTREKLFKEYSHPLNILHNIVPFYEDELKNYQEHIISLINNNLQGLLIHSSEIDKEPLEQGDEDFLQFLNNMFYNIAKYINKRDFIGLARFSKEKMQNFKIPKKARTHQEKLLKDIERIVGDMIEQKKRYLSFQNDKIKYIGATLKMIKDIDSHIIMFCRYICRLYHIFNSNNRDFNRKYYDISSKYFKREKFSEFLKNHFNKYFPLLSRFLHYLILRFWEIRNIDAHEVIANCKFLRNKDLIIIPKTVTHPKIFLNVKKTLRDICNYGQFINRINIHQNSPSDIEDTTYMILE